MTKKLVLFLTCLFPTLLFAQDAFSDCEHIFKKVQQLPSLKVSDKAFEDTLATVFSLKKLPLSDNEITFSFVVTDKSKIDDVVVTQGNTGKEKALKEVIVSLADLWKPATQNGYDVCAYVSLRLKFIENKINIEIIAPEAPAH